MPMNSRLKKAGKYLRTVENIRLTSAYLDVVDIAKNNPNWREVADTQWDGDFRAYFHHHWKEGGYAANYEEE